MNKLSYIIIESIILIKSYSRNVGLWPITSAPINISALFLLLLYFNFLHHEATSFSSLLLREFILLNLMNFTNRDPVISCTSRFIIKGCSYKEKFECTTVWCTLGFSYYFYQQSNSFPRSFEGFFKSLNSVSLFIIKPRSSLTDICKFLNKILGS